MGDLAGEGPQDGLTVSSFQFGQPHLVTVIAVGEIARTGSPDVSNPVGGGMAGDNVLLAVTGLASTTTVPESINRRTSTGSNDSRRGGRSPYTTGPSRLRSRRWW